MMQVVNNLITKLDDAGYSGLVGKATKEFSPKDELVIIWHSIEEKPVLGKTRFGCWFWRNRGYWLFNL